MFILPNASNNGNLYKLDLVLDIPAIQSILDDFTALTKMATALLDLDGNVLVATGWADACTKYHRIHPESCKNCTESDLYLAGNVEPGKYVLYKCKNGLWDVVTPLYISDCHMGNIYGGQFFFVDDELDMDDFRQQAQCYGFDEAKYLAAIEEIPRITREQLSRLMDFLVKLTRLISSIGIRNIQMSGMLADYQAAEATLKASEAKNRALLTAIPDIIFIFDSTGTFLDYRAAANTPLAVDPELIIGNTLAATMPPEVAGPALECIREALATGEVQSFEYTLPNPPVAGSYEARLVKFDQDSVLCISRDISARKRAEEKLQSAASLAHSIVRGSPIPQFVIDENHTVLYWNEALEKHSGLSSQKMIGTNQHWKAFYDNERPCLADLIINNQTGDIPKYYSGKYSKSTMVENAYEAIDFFPKMANDGRWLFFTAAPIRNDQGKILGAVETLEDITVRVQNEEELKHINQVQSLILDNTAVGIAFVRHRLIEWANPRVAEMLGRSREEVKGAPTRIIYALDEDFEYVGLNAYKALGEGDWFEFEGLMQRADGGVFYGRILGKALDPDNTQEGTIWIFEDIDQRMQAEKERDSLRHLMKNIIDSMPSILVAVDTNGAVTQWNLEASRATGIDSTQALNQPLTALLPQYSAHISGLERALADRKIHQEHRIASHNEGELRYSEVMIYPLAANALVGAVVRIDDVTDKVRLEEMMIQTEKMMSVGGLAAGMAHEINNPLSGIMQGIQNIQRRLASDLPRNQETARQFGLDLQAMQHYFENRQIIQMLTGIQEAGNRASIIVNNMLQFSRRSSTEKAPVPADVLIDRALELASNDYDLKKKYDFRHIQISREYEADMPSVWCIATEIEQVLLNLLKNAAHALASSPPLEWKPAITVRTRRDGSMAVLEVEDNGPGMDENLKKRIFEPFFTTKEAGVGTGLGLSVSYFIINENHGGQLFVQSNPGQGARFTIQLPLATDSR